MLTQSLTSMIGGGMAVLASLGSFHSSLQKFKPESGEMVDADLVQGGSLPPRLVAEPVQGGTGHDLTEELEGTARKEALPAQQPRTEEADEAAEVEARTADAREARVVVEEIDDGAARARQDGEQLDKQLTLAEQKENFARGRAAKADLFGALARVTPDISQGVGSAASVNAKNIKAEEEAKNMIFQGAQKVFDQLTSIQQAAVTNALERVQALLQANAQASGR